MSVNIYENNTLKPISGGQPSNGHTIIDENDNEYTQREGLKFTNATIVDDPTNNRTNINIKGEQIQVDTLPTASVDELGKIYQYIGTTTQNYIHGFYYECVEDNGTYSWENIKVQEGDKIQVTTLPTASADELGKVYQYLGADTNDYKHGYFYECKLIDGSYVWKNCRVQDSILYITPPTVTVGEYTYDGTAQGPTITWNNPNDADKCIVTNATKTDAGSYTLTITLKDTGYMSWEDNTNAPKTYEWSIGKATLTVPTVSGSFTYDGTQKSATVSGFDSTTMTKSGDTATNVGSYTVTFGLVDSSNYQWTTTPATGTWSIEKGTPTISLSTSTANLYPQQTTATVAVTKSTNEVSVTATSSNTSVATVLVSGNNVTITRASGGTATVTISTQSNSNWNAASSKTVSVDSLVITTFANGSDAQIKKMLDAYYQDKITWSQMGWAVGDTRKIHLNAMTVPQGGPGSGSWAAQDITIVIVAHDHHTLATPVNGHTKGCITVQPREVLNNISAFQDVKGCIYPYGQNIVQPTFIKWANVYLRTYLNNTVLGAIPSGDFKNAIKQSKHYRRTTHFGTTAEEVIDTLFIPSVPEIVGTSFETNFYSATSPAEGTQLQYYKTTANRIKYGNNNGSSNGVEAEPWFLGCSSIYQNNNYAYWSVMYQGQNGGGVGDRAYSLDPAWVM